MLRLRTSTGIRPTGFFGNFYMQNTTDIELSAIDSDKSIQIEIKYDDKLDEREPAFFQLAILFTSCSGQRRLRVHNLSLPVTSDYQKLYRHIDEDCLISHLFKQAEQCVRDKCPKEMRDELTLRAAQILAAYREKCSEPAPAGQLILPEFAKLLPLHINCIIRHDSLNGGAELTVDDRAWMMSLVPSMTPTAIQQFLYPRIYPITSLGSSVVSDSAESLRGVSSSTNTTSAEFPTPIRASYDYFSSNDAYLIDNGLVAFIWCGSGVPNCWLNDVFNVASVAHLDTEKHQLPAFDNTRSHALRRLWAHLNEGRERALKLFIVKEQDALESWMKKFLVEDRYANNAHSYVDFLCLIHREIRSLIS
jgi:protein transport protein SEC24